MISQKIILLRKLYRKLKLRCKEDGYKIILEQIIFEVKQQKTLTFGLENKRVWKCLNTEK